MEKRLSNIFGIHVNNIESDNSSRWMEEVSIFRFQEKNPLQELLLNVYSINILFIEINRWLVGKNKKHNIEISAPTDVF